MTATVTDLFSGAGGSSLGAEWAGAQVVMAANHWDIAAHVYSVRHPETRVDLADISQADPRRYPVTDILIASPECTNHSQARGVSRKRQDPTLWDAPDPSAERSRATMWDVPRFAEQNRYAAVIVENVVEAAKWVGWRGWCQVMADLGYERHVLSHNAMHHGVPQSRDRIFVVFTRRGLKVDLEMELDGWCPRCAGWTVARQAWKNGRTVGRHGQAYRWACTSCSSTVEVPLAPAVGIIDWTIPTPRFGDKKRSPKTRRRVWGGMVRHGWVPFLTAGAGNTWEHSPGMRARPLSGPMATQQTVAQHALAIPPGFLVQTAHGGRLVELGQPHPTICGSDDRHALVVPLRRNGRPRDLAEPIPTVTAGGHHHALVVRQMNGRGADSGYLATPVDEPLRTVVGTSRHALLLRNHGGNADGHNLATPIDEPARTFTGAGNQALLTPEYLADDGRLILCPDLLVDEVGFRLLTPAEIELGQGLPAGYVTAAGVATIVAQVKLIGNGVCPPNMAWPMGRVLRALEEAA